MVRGRGELPAGHSPEGHLIQPGAAAAAAETDAALSRALASTPPILPLRQSTCVWCVRYGQGAAHGSWRPTEAGDLSYADLRLRMGNLGRCGGWR